MKNFKNKINRDISINITETYILFYFTDMVDNFTFYDISIEDWKSNKGKIYDLDFDFHYHIKQKNWFTDEMYNYLETNIK